MKLLPGSAFSIRLVGLLGLLCAGSSFAGPRLEIERTASTNLLRVVSEQPGPYVIESAAYLSNYAVGFWFVDPDDGRRQFIVTGYSNATPWQPSYFLQTTANENSLALAPSAESSRFFRAKSFDGSVGPMALSPWPIAAVPGGMFNLDWVFTNATAGLEQLIRLRAPGELAPANPALLHSGTAVGGSELFYLNSEGAWTITETVYTNAAFGGRLTNAFPLVREGEWQLEFLLREPETGRIVELAAEPLLTGLGPRMRLSLSRHAAGPDDSVRADVRLTGGGGIIAREVKLAAWIIMPDGTQLSLPAFEPGLAFLHEGPATNQMFTLFHRHFTTEGLGDYGIEARLYDAGTLELLGLASGRFTVCDGAPKTIAGQVFRSAGAPLGVGNSAVAEVNAFSLEDATVTATSAINSSGNYSLNVQPGRYTLFSRVEDSLGVHEAVHPEILSVPCDAGPLTINLTSAPPDRVRLAALPRRPATQTVAQHPLSPALAGNVPDSLPPPKVRIAGVGINVNQDLVDLIVPHVASSLRSGARGVNFSSVQQLGALARLFTLSQSLGTSSEAQATWETSLSTTLTRALGDVDFLLSVELSSPRNVTPPRYKLLLRLINAAGGTVIRSAESATLQSQEEIVDAAESLSAKMANDDTETDANLRPLLAKLRSVQPHPLLPSLTLIAPTNVTVGGVVTFRGTLREKNASGALQPDQPVKIVWKTPSGQGTATVSTDPGGAYTWSEPVGSVPGSGEVTVSFSRNGRTELARDTKHFTVDPPGGRLSVTAPSAEVLPGTLVNLRVRWLSPPITLLSPRLSLAGATRSTLVPTNRIVSLNASTNGTLSSTNVTLDANGEATVAFTAGPRTGIASIQASYTPSATNPPVNAQRWLAIEGNVQTFLFANLTNIFVGSGTTITAEALVAGARVTALPVSFALTGPGQLSAASGLTDDNGQVVITYHAPTNGTGSAQITAIATASGQSHTNSLTVTYSPLTACPGQGGAVYCLTPITVPGYARLQPIYPRPLNNLGHVVVFVIVSEQAKYFYWASGTATEMFTSIISNQRHSVALNDSGQVLNQGSQHNGFSIWQNGVFTEIDGPLDPLGSATIPKDINNSGQVLLLVQSQAKTSAYVWQNGAYIVAADTNILDVLYINDRRQITVNTGVHPYPYPTLIDGFTTPVPLQWNGQWVGQWDGPYSRQFPSITGLNNRGHVLGVASSLNGGVVLSDKVVLWRNGRWDIIVDGSQTPRIRQPTSCNDLDEIVGYEYRYGLPEPPTPRLWKNGQTFDLNALIDSNSGWRLDVPIGINNRGQILCLGYFNDTGRTNQLPCLLTPAAPF